MSMPRFFRNSEFDCKCGCGLNNVNKEFIGVLDYARGRAGTPFVVTSGSRCEKHNKDVGGNSKSEHLTGDGVDILADNGFKKWRVVTALVDAGVRRIGIADKFVHAGNDLVNKPPEIIWIYPPKKEVMKDAS